MLKQGFDVYLPLVDDDAIDVVIKRPDGKFVEVQIKARSKNVIFGDGALFTSSAHTPRKNYFFVFYSERHDKIWILSSSEFLKHSYANKKGSNVGKRNIWLNGKRKNTETGQPEEHIHTRFARFEVMNHDFHRIIGTNGV